LHRIKWSSAVHWNRTIWFRFRVGPFLTQCDIIEQAEIAGQNCAQKRLYSFMLFYFISTVQNIKTHEQAERCGNTHKDVLHNYQETMS